MEDVEIYSYGMLVLFYYLLNVASFVLLALIFGYLLESIAFFDNAFHFKNVYWRISFWHTYELLDCINVIVICKSEVSIIFVFIVNSEFDSVVNNVILAIVASSLLLIILKIMERRSENGIAKGLAGCVRSLV